MPKVSVLMPVYNGEKHIGQAIDSVLSQSFRDFELIVIDDGSTDKSAEVVGSYSDKRICYVANPTNLGLAGARNRAIDVSNGDYLAWLDCDDISLPSRLLKQVALLDEHPNVGLCGTWVRTLGLESEKVWRYASDPRFLRARMLFDDPVATSAAMIRRSCIAGDALRFDVRFPPAEDYDLWERISRTNEVRNIPEVLTLYRIHSGQISTAKREQQSKSIWEIQSRLLRQLCVEPTEEEKLLHLDIGVGWNFLADKVRLDQTEEWLHKLEKANHKEAVFPKDGFRNVLSERWFLANRAAVGVGGGSWTRYSSSILACQDPVTLRRYIRFLSFIRQYARELNPKV